MFKDILNDWLVYTAICVICLFMAIYSVKAYSAQGDTIINYQEVGNPLSFIRAQGTKSGGLSVSPASAATFTSLSYSISNVVTKISATNTSRKSIAIRNLGAGTVYCCASNVTSSTGFPVYSGEILSIDNYTSAIYIVTAGSDTATVITGEDY